MSLLCQRHASAVLLSHRYLQTLTASCLVGGKRYVTIERLKRALLGRRNFNANDSVKSFNDFNIVPDIVDRPPQHPLTVQFVENGVEARFGNVLKPKDVFTAPQLQWDHDKSKFYTVVMVDPDLPSKTEPILRSFQIWLVGNIPGQNLAKGESLVSYIGAGPPRNSGYHRYVLLVYEQADKLDFEQVARVKKYRLPRYRNNFCFRDFAHNYRLGDPIAGNFFLAQYDDHVPNVYKKLENLTNNWKALG